MAQVLEFKLPDLGEGLTEAEIVRWLVQVGDVVAVDQPVVEVETAKAMVEVPCPYGGVVTARFGEEGTELPVGAPLITVAVGAPASGADTAAQAGSRTAARPAGDTAAAPEASEGSGNVLVGYGTGAPPARRPRVRPQPPGATPPPPASGSAPAAPAQDTPRAAPAGGTRAGGDTPVNGDGPVPVISPLVRRLARENGLDLRELTGSGPDGLILRADVEYALRAAAAQGGRTTAPHPEPQARAAARPEGSAQAPASTAVGGGTRVPLKGVRGAVADKLSRSRREIPDATCWVDADATELMRARAAMNAAGGPKISLLALLARICTAALARYPELNSTVDLAAREVVRLDQVHLGFAAQTERGLVVPVVRDAHARDAEGLTAEFARLTEAARAGRLTPGELTGGTFTLNNYGVFGVDGSTPIINHPEAAMLGVGRIVPKPWVHEGELAVRQVVQLSLTFDHRVCDGGTAGGFLRYVADCVEQPAVLLRTL
ncbi:dihydrolipoamide acetyltransferase family protein [Streptomyces glaucescens]|uniref:Dihydrolipoamide acetyltransferase component of pyruvate dehydrogenase complex n=1 Tax=Streptomyces glaucescens TaxID=1907 RepID=A0A089Z0U2_STRGA|nr:dihydrolipoamide acetyltransferase family protein [Streptomyces glaucescens]AIR99465.1 branched-chain alpha-keto acid dehydrogenase subunit E2 [Streptomyces glaucescens]